MGLKQVKNYYKSVEKLYFDMLHSFESMKDELNKGNVTEEELEKIMTPVNNIRDNYLRLSYIIYLFNQPSNEKKIKRYTTQTKQLADTFTAHRVDSTSDLADSEDALKVFKANLAEFEKNTLEEGE